MTHNKVEFVFDDRSLEKISDVKEQGFMNATDIMELAKANNDVYLTAYREGQAAALRVATRMAGAIEDFLEGESQGNVTGLRQALTAFEAANPGAP